MKRRKFLQTAALASVVAVTKPTSAFSISNEPRTFLPDFELEEMTITQLQAALTSGRFSSKALVAKYLDHISDIDRDGPKLNSVIELNPEASAIAEGLDDERKAGRVRAPLHGIPLLIKDNIDTADRMTTTAGSLALLGSHRTRDSFVAQKLREAGAVLLGKTNMSEWANFRSSKSSSGWSARGGQTRNPYILDRNPCGSSSGSGVAPAANLCAAAIGTETDGSVVCPSSANSLVGIKPTIGLVSRSGIIPIAHSQDTAGPMARTVEDAAILLAAISGIDSRDSATKSAVGKFEKDYRKFLDRNGLRGARIGVARKYMGFNQGVDKLIEQSIATMKQLGAVMVDPADIPTAGKFDESELEVLLYEFKADLNAYLAAAGSSVPVHSLKEIIDFNEKNRDREMPFFGQDLFIKAQAKGPLTSRAYVAALRKNHLLSRGQGIDFVMRKHRLDAMIAPTGSPAWPTDLLNGDHFTGGYSSASAVAGYPHITVPAGYVHGLPVGLSFFAGAWAEPKLIKYAYAFEQATKARTPPKFLKTAQVG
ncbi:MAG TPA: amidase [Pyrinomonadaceae bacterium]|nr:amidase [Pyrinomonadaceae bacterium]